MRESWVARRGRFEVEGQVGLAVLLGGHCLVELDLALQRLGVIGKPTDKLVGVEAIAKPLAEKILAVDEVDRGVAVQANVGVTDEIVLGRHALAEIKTVFLIDSEDRAEFRGREPARSLEKVIEAWAGTLGPEEGVAFR